MYKSKWVTAIHSNIISVHSGLSIGSLNSARLSAGTLKRMEFLRHILLGLATAFLLAINVDCSRSIVKDSLSSSFHANRISRMKREVANATGTSANITIESGQGQQPDSCVMKCLRSTEERLASVQEETVAGKSGSQGPFSPQGALSNAYDPRDFEKLCNAYRPGRKCLDTCEESRLKTAAVKGMQLLQFMCIEKYEDFKANLPCMNNASLEAEEACKGNCSENEAAVNRLEELSGNRDLVGSVSQQQLTSILSESCQYVDCLEHCGSPITERKCGKKVADLDGELVRQVFHSLRNTVTALGAADQLPNECLKLGE